MSDRAPPRDATEALYRRFAEHEARGRSPLYEALAQAVADDDEILRFLLTLPGAKRQPNLLLAAVRHLCGTPADARDFCRRLLANEAAVRDLMLRRSTQTNEPARCAVLLPALAALPQPLALLEVGASAGLCLLPDHYGYDYGRVRIAPPTAMAPVFRCIASPGTPLPDRVPQIVWRAGLDLEPVSVADPRHRAWLEVLVWPEQTARLERLRQAMAVAETVRPRIVQGDLRHDLAALAAEAPREATLVVFHTAVLGYVGLPAERQAFAALAQRLAGCWIANEVPSVFPDIARRAGPAQPGFVLSVDGEPVAWTDPHGASLDWIASG
jgi:hypothetical protein